jgi:hypothetical protein
MDLMYVMSFVLTAIFPDPRDFMWPAVISFGAVALAALLFTKYALIHLDG